MSDFVLTDDNYYSAEAQKHYLSNSDLKVFQECQYRYTKMISGEWQREETEALLQGSLLDAMLTGTPQEVEKSKADHPQIYSSRGATKGELKSSFKIVEQMYDKVINDPKGMKMLDGEHQKIFTGTLFGIDMRCKLDVYQEHNAIVDLKTVSSLHQSYWDVDLGRRTTFVQHFKYIQQLAIYQELVYQTTGEKLPCYILAVTKENPVDIQPIYFDNQSLHDAIYGNEFEQGLANDFEQLRLIRNGELEPLKCGECEVCISEKVVGKPIHFTELEGLIK